MAYETTGNSEEKTMKRSSKMKLAIARICLIRDVSICSWDIRYTAAKLLKAKRQKELVEQKK